MGCGISRYEEIRLRQYSVPVQSVPQMNQGETEIRRHPQFLSSLKSQPDGETDTLKKTLLRSVRLFGDRPFLGTIVDGAYNFITYNQAYEQATCLGNGMLNQHLIKPLKEYQNLELFLVGVFAKNQAEWILLDLANMIYGFTMVPLYDTLGADSIPFILEQTNIETLFLANHSLKTFFQVKDTKKLKNLVFFDEIKPDEKDVLLNRGFSIFNFKDVIAAGKIQKQNNYEPTPDTIFTFSYTSGTTGNPKGAMLTHRNFVSGYSVLPQVGINLTENDVHLSYLPLPHVMERLVLMCVLYAGSSIGFYRGDSQLIKEDIQLLRPTFFMSVPRLYNKFYDGIKGKMNELSGFKKSVADRAISVKLENLKNDAVYTHSLYDKVFENVRTLFGGRCKFMITGSAPILPEVLNFMKIAVSVPLYEGYGQTESTGGSFASADWEPEPGIMGPTANTEFKLVDIPEMSYLHTDQPNPRGEVCIRGHGVFKGYYKDNEKTKEAIDQDGWLHTGDVGMLLSNGGIRIIDRKKNIFKLSQGEYIAPDKIEAIYNRAEGVAETFIYGDSLQDKCVAIIVPKQEHVTKLAHDLSIQGNFQELCKNKQIIEAYLKTTMQHAKDSKLNSLEQAKKIYLEPRSFAEHQCVTTTFKLQRHLLKTVFQNQISEMYQEK